MTQIKTKKVQIRLTKQCNADCSYCSSFSSKRSFMSKEDVLTSIQFIIDRYFFHTQHLNISYLGGEVTMIPFEKLSDIVLSVRSFLDSKGISHTDGIQSNLTLPQKTLSQYFQLFEGRIGTSIDNHTKQRTIKGCHETYQEKFMKNLIYFDSKEKSKIPAIIVIDKNNKDFILDEYKKSNQDHRHLTFRPVFLGGKDSIHSLSNDELLNIYSELFLSWFMKGNITINPLFNLVSRRLKTRNNIPLNSYCPWQSDCTQCTVNIDPDGEIFQCQELADKRFASLGNALTGEFNKKQYQELSKRVVHIAKQCNQCTYYLDCKGGCMADSLEKNGNIIDKTPYCDVWFSLFSLLDENINKYPKEEIIQWLQKINN